MTNEEIIKMLRELSEKADAAGEVKSKKIRIDFSREPEIEEEEEPLPEGVPDKTESGEMPEDLPERTQHEEQGRVSDEAEDESSPGRLAGLFARFRRKKTGKGSGKDPEKHSSRKKRKEDAALSTGHPDVSADALEELLSDEAADPRENDLLPDDVTVYRDTEEAGFESLHVNPEVHESVKRHEESGMRESAGQHREQEEDSAGVQHRKAKKDKAGARRRKPEEDKAGARRRKPEEAGPGREAPDFESDADAFTDLNLAPGHGTGLGKKILTGLADRKERSAEKKAKAEEEKENAQPDGEESLEETGKTLPEDEETGKTLPEDEETRTEMEAEPGVEDSEETLPGKQDTEADQQELTDILRRFGIGKKQLAIAGGILLLLIVLAVLISHMVSERHKRRNVVTEDGLRVSVEKEPSKWVTHGDVVLTVKTGSPIQSITINQDPVSFSGENTARVSYDAVSEYAELMVVTEEKVMSATVEYPKIDSEDPRIDVSLEGGKIILDTVDERSGVDEIWYGVIDGLSEVPAYELYTEPFVPEQGRLYSYFATDCAGNVSAPVVTNLTPAEKMELARTEVSAFPGETVQMQLDVVPAKAFLNDLTWSSSDPQVAVVDDQGLVTALADGKTVIEAKASGMKSASCTVNVNSEVSLTISAVGDVTLGEDSSFSPLNNFTAVYSKNGESWFFDNVRSIFQADDITFANFEGTLTDQGTRADKQFAFRGDPSYVGILNDGSVEAVTLANNHSQDYGEVSLTDTQKYLEEAGVDWCSGDKIIIRDEGGVRVALIGIYVLAEGEAKAQQVEETIAKAKEEDAQIIIVAFHWGNELEKEPDKVQRTLGRLAVDAGADLVVGHHPHVLQGIEKYAGKYICYSLGNFCFGGNTNPTDKDSIIFQQTFNIRRGGETEAGAATVIPCSISSDPSWNNYQPTPATGEEADRIMERINSLSEPFKTSF